MNAANDLAQLYIRDLKRLAEEIAAYPTEASLWATMPGISNSAGHLVLHLEGNLREFVGRQLGGVAYSRNRPREFAAPSVPQADLLSRIAWLGDYIPAIIAALTSPQLDSEFPLDILGRPVSTHAMLIHLDGHLQWHLGQIDYLRRILSASGAIALSTL